VPAVANFASSLLLRQVSHGDRLLAPSLRSHPGSVVAFLDISGYTKLSESMCSLGAAGTEKLSEALSVYFERAIHIITGHGGDVIKFCGDALMCAFPSEGRKVNKQVAVHTVARGGEMETVTETQASKARPQSTPSPRSASPLASPLGARAGSLRGGAGAALRDAPRARLAMQCCLRAMEKLSGYEISEEVTLDLKIMLG
jgi:class 3 adenylate cyclase